MWQQELEPGSSSMSASLEENRRLLLQLHESENRIVQLQNEVASLHERLAVLEDENIDLSILLKESQETSQKREAELEEVLSSLVSKLSVKKRDMNE